MCVVSGSSAGDFFESCDTMSALEIVIQYVNLVDERKFEEAAQFLAEDFTFSSKRFTWKKEEWIKKLQGLPRLTWDAPEVGKHDKQFLRKGKGKVLNMKEYMLETIEVNDDKIQSIMVKSLSDHAREVVKQFRILIKEKKYEEASDMMTEDFQFIAPQAEKLYNWDKDTWIKKFPELPPVAWDAPEVGNHQNQIVTKGKGTFLGIKQKMTETFEIAEDGKIQKIEAVLSGAKLPKARGLSPLRKFPSA